MKQLSMLLTDKDLALLLPHILQYASEIRIVDVAPAPSHAPPLLEHPPQKKLDRFHKTRRRPTKTPESREPLRQAIRECLKVDVVTPTRIHTWAREFKVDTRVIHNVLYVMKMRGEIEAFKTRGLAGVGTTNSYRLAKKPPALIAEPA